MKNAVAVIPHVVQSYADLLTPGVQVSLAADEAEALGVVEEDALSERDAWESNGDPSNFDAARPAAASQVVVPFKRGL